MNSEGSLIDRIVQSATKQLRKIVLEAGIAESHGLGHMLAVLENLKRALASNANDRSRIEISEGRQLALQLGALLHDADDKKLFAAGSNNAVTIIKSVMDEFGDGLKMCSINPKKVEAEAMETISYVSASDNGN